MFKDFFRVSGSVRIPCKLSLWVNKETRVYLLLVDVYLYDSLRTSVVKTFFVQRTAYIRTWQKAVCHITTTFSRKV
jgi:hypothetical protein